MSYIDPVAVYPSSIKQIEIDASTMIFRVHIPQDEQFRVGAIFKKREYEIPTRYLASKELLVVDIGANAGLFSLYLKSIRPDCVIHCFEPAPHMCKLLEINTRQFPEIHLHPFGLGDKSSTVRMDLHPHNTGENSIKRKPSAASRCIDVQIVEAQEAFSSIGLGYIDVLKIDTEGCEVEILTSLQPRLRYIGVILLEYHSEQDRRHIDQLLFEFKLFNARIAGTECGVLKYVNAALL